MSETVQQMADQASERFLEWLQLKCPPDQGLFLGMTEAKVRELADAFMAGYMRGRESRGAEA